MATDLQYERETTIVFNEAEDKARVWSASPIFHRRMAKYGILPTKTSERERGEQSCWYEVPRSWVKVKPKVQREITLEQRERMSRLASERFKGKARAETKGNPLSGTTGEPC